MAAIANFFSWLFEMLFEVSGSHDLRVIDLHMLKCPGSSTLYCDIQLYLLVKKLTSRSKYQPVIISSLLVKESDNSFRQDSARTMKIIYKQLNPLNQDYFCSLFSCDICICIHIPSWFKWLIWIAYTDVQYVSDCKRVHEIKTILSSLEFRRKDNLSVVDERTYLS